MAKGRVLNTTISLMVAFLCGGVIGWVYEVFLCGPFNGDGIDLGHGGIGIPFLATPDGLICFRASLTFGLMGLLQLRAVRALRVRLIAANAKATLIVCAILIAIVIFALLNAMVFHWIDVGETWH